VLDNIGSTGLDASQIDDIRRVIAETGALASVESKIGVLTESAVRSLAVLDLRADVHEKFVAIAHATAWRSV
jgi:dihydrodipicolinate reductase